MIRALAAAVALAQQPGAATASTAAPPVAEVPGLLVERRLAESVPLRVGDTVRVRALAGREPARPFVVAGVFEREADPNRIARNEYEVRWWRSARAPSPARSSRTRPALPSAWSRASTTPSGS